MELVLELFVTAVIAVLFSFLIAKLVSLATAGDSSQRSRSKNVVVDEETIGDGDVSEEVIMEELQFRETLEVLGFESEKRAEFVQDAAEKVDKFVSEPAVHVEQVVESVIGEPVVQVEQVVESVNREEVIETDSFGLELPQKSIEGELKEEKQEEEKEVLKKKEREFDSKNVIEQSKEIMEKKEGEFDSQEVKKEANLDNLLKENREVDEPIENDVVVEQAEEEVKISIVEGEAKENVKEEKRVEIESDDDWEGIERSELEKVFMEAAKFVESGEKDEKLGSIVGSDVQMELYGLHKVATEGPCHEQPPMALNFPARAKCDGGHWLRCARNAWQRLGNMSPDVAMEQYVALVSDRVSGWMEDKSTGDGKPGSSKAASPTALTRDLSTFSSHPPNIMDERNPELKSIVGKSDLTGDLSLESKMWYSMLNEVQQRFFLLSK